MQKLRLSVALISLLALGIKPSLQCDGCCNSTTYDTLLDVQNILKEMESECCMCDEN